MIPHLLTRIINPDITLRRTVQDGLKHHPEASQEWHYERFHRHLLEKYAPGRHLKLWAPHSKNTQQLKTLQSIIADEVRLKAIFETLYHEESVAEESGQEESAVEEPERSLLKRMFTQVASFLFKLVLYPLVFIIVLLLLGEPPVGMGGMGIKGVFFVSTSLVLVTSVLITYYIDRRKVLWCVLRNLAQIGVCISLSQLDGLFWCLFSAAIDS